MDPYPHISKPFLMRAISPWSLPTTWHFHPLTRGTKEPPHNMFNMIATWTLLQLPYMWDIAWRLPCKHQVDETKKTHRQLATWHPLVYHMDPMYCHCHEMLPHVISQCFHIINEYQVIPMLTRIPHQNWHMSLPHQHVYNDLPCFLPHQCFGQRSSSIIISIFKWAFICHNEFFFSVVFFLSIFPCPTYWTRNWLLKVSLVLFVF